MAKYSEFKLNVISLFFREVMLTNLFFLPIELSFFHQYTLVYDKNKKSVLGLDDRTIELWKRNHELALRDFIQFR